ncbi:MAG: electron transfer flavoprotein subunit alpha/FixB family protein [Bacteroidia bacterium]|nr:electron transfer flavoprotein subunit alpha/FixB family protein [Bacteroidia bacterium]
MSVLVYVENQDGKFRNAAFEALSFGNAIATSLGTGMIACSIGKVSDEELKCAGKYGASVILSASPELINPQVCSGILSKAAVSEKATVVIVPASFFGKAVAPRVAVKLKAAYGDNVVELPQMSSGFIVKKGAYSGKAFEYVELLSEVKVISLVPNSFKMVEKPVEIVIKTVDATVSDPEKALKVIDTVRNTNKVSLPDAEIVVSAGRGLKGPENWGMIEELASVLGAATACSKPVSDAGWRPHSEHVGQTGIAISPNLYIAIGISGAIQHLAGVSNSKVIVVINKDPEAPFFKAADYGIVGDAFEVVPKLIEAAKKFKAAGN